MSDVGDVEVYTWYAMMMGAFAAIPEEDKVDLLEWERRFLNGHIAETSDWPGWEKFIGQKPVLEAICHQTKKKPIPPEIRWQVWERDNFICQGCGARRYLSVDHIIPESKGGTLALDNLQTLCKPCNSRKGSHHD